LKRRRNVVCKGAALKKRASDRQPWMSPEVYGRSIRPGIGFNLLVKDVARSVKFAEDVLGATATYWDEDFAVLRLNGSEWMLHADHTYSDNPLSGVVGSIEARGAGVELRVYGCDPDQAEAQARARGFTVLAGTIDKPHGLRECMLVDDDGYVWVPGVASTYSRD
jgi:catechol 2,3-dioxygenase-like lactoylglutathione lyase family enzyme